MQGVDFAVLGAGAMGSIVGAHLARAGHSVMMIARGQRARQIEQHGLRICGLAQFSQSVPVITDAATLAGAEVLIVATKTHAARTALLPLQRVPIGTAFSMQNGMMKNELLIGALGRERVLGSLADASGELLSDGEVLFTRNVMLYLGELDGTLSERAQQIASAIAASGVKASAVEQILRHEWDKFASWAGLMALSVTTRANTWKFLADPHAACVVIRLVREVGVLAQACGIELSDRSTLPVATICRGTESEAIAVCREVGLRMQIHAPEHRMSTLQDLLAGRALEVEETLGYAVEQARQRNLSLPLLETFYQLISGIDRIQTLK
jgi:2-dehydropantoate 2-reductase